MANFSRPILRTLGTNWLNAEWYSVTFFQAYIEREQSREELEKMRERFEEHTVQMQRQISEECEIVRQQEQTKFKEINSKVIGYIWFNICLFILFQNISNSGGQVFNWIEKSFSSCWLSKLIQLMFLGFAVYATLPKWIFITRHVINVNVRHTY